jgi:catechol 2,3-dioxygenase-like lactoylglutathione lyase family enzyme
MRPETTNPDQGIRIRAIDHVVLRTEDPEAMVAFYRDVLGCQVERELPEIGLIQLRAGASLIDIVPVDSELGRKGGGPPDPRGRNLDHLCLQVEGMDEGTLSRWLVEHGIEGVEFERRYGALGFGPSVYVEDPDGNTVELKL